MQQIKQIAEQVIAAVREYVAKSASELADKLEKRIDALPKPERGERGERGEPGKDGAPGQDGARGEAGVSGERGEKGDPGERGVTGERGADGINGKDGAPGVEGRSITVDDMRPLFDSAMATWQLEFERRGMDTVQRTLERIEKPKDGRDGKDGRDAFDFATFDLKVEDDFRTWRVSATAGTELVERILHIPVPMFQGVYVSGEKYERGDIVAFGGSAFIARRDTTSKPETDASWTLFVKRGRDGKDGQKGERGEPGAAGVRRAAL